jgi:hypothetical protein
MRVLIAWLVAGALLAIVASGQVARADEEKIPLDKVPKAVLDAVKARFAGAQLTGAEKEVENGKTLYEIALKYNDHKIEAAFTPDGKLVEIEKQVPASDIPAAVRQALEIKYPNATFKMVEEVTKVTNGQETLEYYEVLLETAQNKKFEVCVTAEGKITKEEDKSKGKG